MKPSELVRECGKCFAANQRLVLVFPGRSPNGRRMKLTTSDARAPWGRALEVTDERAVAAFDAAEVMAWLVYMGLVHVTALPDGWVTADDEWEIN